MSIAEPDHALTAKWVRGPADEAAVENGCWFDEARAQHIIDVMCEHFRFYEGELAGQAFEPLPWQEDCLKRIFGWVRWSDKLGREVRRFRKASIWCPKKNGKSPLAAAVGLYLLAFDGEQGQKVYSAAKDGKQAGIVHNHAMQMVKRSPFLTGCCTINRTNKRIIHETTQSNYDVLPGDNIDGQEGLNGSVVIDETHVVDGRLANVLEYMGISRSEPLQFEVSTAGNNPMGYGKRQYDYGKQVEKGDVIDEEFFFACWESPQDVSDEDCGDPEIWRMANPSMGHILNEVEMGKSYERAKRSPSDLQQFKMYRLNVWSTGVSPWLKMDHWNQCVSNFTPEDFLGQECCAGFDLGQVEDMTAMVLCFERDEEYYLLPYFWHSEQKIREMRGILPYEDWRDRGYLLETPGNTIDPGFTKAKILELSEKFIINKLIFDPWQAWTLTSELEEQHGIQREEFRQGSISYAEPMNEFERLVLEHKLHHNDNPILTWNAGNTNAKQDPNGNKRPVKPPESDHRKIDGIVAAIMALSGTMDTEQSAGLMLL
jgi:phage terminase large subunit-like protein